MVAACNPSIPEAERQGLPREAECWMLNTEYKSNQDECTLSASGNAVYINKVDSGPNRHLILILGLHTSHTHSHTHLHLQAYQFICAHIYVNTYHTHINIWQDFPFPITLKYLWSRRPVVGQGKGRWAKSCRDRERLRREEKPRWRRMDRKEILISHGFKSHR